MSVGAGSACGAPYPVPGELGKATFGYVCTCGPPPSSDAWCDTGTGDKLPDVAVAATFSLASQPSGAEPVDPSVGVLSSDGWTLSRPGWLGFVVYQGSSVLDFVHIRGRSVASLRLTAALLSVVEAGGSTVVATMPLADDGTVLAGAFECTFVSSNTTLATVSSQGRLGIVQGISAGDVTVTATCFGQTASVLLHVVGGRDAGDDGVAVDAGSPDQYAGDSTVQTGPDAAENADSASAGAEPEDAPSAVDAEGG